MTDDNMQLRFYFPGMNRFSKPIRMSIPGSWSSKLIQHKKDPRVVFVCLINNDWRYTQQECRLFRLRISDDYTHVVDVQKSTKLIQE